MTTCNFRFSSSVRARAETAFNLKKFAIYSQTNYISTTDNRHPKYSIRQNIVQLTTQKAETRFEWWFKELKHGSIDNLKAGDL